MRYVVHQCNVMTRIIEASSATEALQVLKRIDFRYSNFWQHGNMIYNPNRQSDRVDAWEYEEDY